MKQEPCSVIRSRKPSCRTCSPRIPRLAAPSGKIPVKSRMQLMPAVMSSVRGNPLTGGAGVSIEQRRVLAVIATPARLEGLFLLVI